MTLQRDGTSGPAPARPASASSGTPRGRTATSSSSCSSATTRRRGQRANSGVQVRFPAPHPPVPGCPTTFNGEEQNNAAAGSPSTAATRCRSTTRPTARRSTRARPGSIYGFADLDSAAARTRRRKGVWNDLEIKVVGQHYTVVRNGVVINEFENVPGCRSPAGPTTRARTRAASSATSGCSRTAGRTTSCRSGTSGSRTCRTATEANQRRGAGTRRSAAAQFTHSVLSGIAASRFSGIASPQLSQVP